VCVVLVIQHAGRMRRTVLPSVSSLALPYFFHIVSKTVRFFGNELLNIRCVFLFSLQILLETFLILRTIKRDDINVHTSSRKAPVILARF